MTEVETLRMALKWALQKGVYVETSGCGFRDRGCGCCSSEEEPPPEIDAIMREIRREILKEQR